MKRKGKRMPIWALVVTDVLLSVFALGVFMLFDYVLPKKSHAEGKVVSKIDEGDEHVFSLPSDDENGSSNITSSNNFSSVSNNSFSRSNINTGNTNTTMIELNYNEANNMKNAKIIATKIQDYSDNNVKFTITKNETGSGKSKITYYTSDIYISNIKYIKTAFAEKTYGKNIKDSVKSMAMENNALLAVNGDFYGNSEEGIVIRNGKLYRNNLNDADICVLFTDGSMETYSPSEFDSKEVIKRGAWQAWNFGPKLLDGKGNTLNKFNTTSYLNSKNPRTAIGYISNGHYKLVVVDGRNEGYSRGVTMTEMAQIMANEGCLSAYNLDGGKSSAMFYNGSYVNKLYEGGRDVSDIVYIGE